MRDMDSRNRRVSVRGEAHGAVKLADYEVAEIRATYVKNKRGYGSPALAARFGVSARHILDIVQGSVRGSN